jgi:uncharacterized protein YbcI
MTQESARLKVRGPPRTGSLRGGRRSSSPRSSGSRGEKVCLRAGGLRCPRWKRCPREGPGRGEGPLAVRQRLLFAEEQPSNEGVLTTAGESLVRTTRSNHAQGIGMIREMRNHLVRQSRSRLLAELSDALGKQATGMMHDIDSESGSEVLVFRLADAQDSKPLA